MLLPLFERYSSLLQCKEEKSSYRGMVRGRDSKNRKTMFFIQRTSLTTCVTCVTIFKQQFITFIFPYFASQSLPLRLLSLYYFLLDLTESSRERDEDKWKEKMDKRKRVCYKKYRCDSLAKNESETEGKIHESWHGSWCCFFLMVVYILVASLISPFFLPNFIPFTVPSLVIFLSPFPSSPFKVRVQKLLFLLLLSLLKDH